MASLLSSQSLVVRFALVTISLIIAAEPAIAGEPPRIRGPTYSPATVLSGTPIYRIDCRVDVFDATNGLIVSWYWNEELIHTQWDRYSISEGNGKWFLRIRDVHAEDAGNFSCEATNGFGRAKFILNLQVVDSSNRSQTAMTTSTTTTSTTAATRPTTSSGPVVAEQTSPQTNGGQGQARVIVNAKAPKFDGQKGMQTSMEVERYVGGSAELQCRARGNPAPGILWLRDNQPIQITGTRVGTVKIGRWTLRLSDLRLSDSGRYTCRAYNDYGEIEFTYILKVHGDEALIPKVTTTQVNVTLHAGDTALLPCTVKSDRLPHVQWVKRVGGASSSRNGYKQPADSLPSLPGDQAQNDNVDADQQTPNVTDENDDYKVLIANAPQMDEHVDDLYYSYLRIEKVSEMDAGTYLCWAKNVYGYSHAELRVRIIAPNGQVIDAPPSANGKVPATIGGGRIILDETGNDLGDRGRLNPTAKAQSDGQSSDGATQLDGRNLISVYIIVPVLVVIGCLLVAIYYWKNRHRIRAKQTRLRLHYSAAANNSNHGLLLECTTSSSSAAAAFYNVNGPLCGSGSRLLHSGNPNDYQLSCHAVPSLMNAVPVSGSGFNIADTHFTLQNNISPSSSQQKEDCGYADSAEYTQSSRYTQSSSCTATNNNNMMPSMVFSPADGEFQNFAVQHPHARSAMQKQSRMNDRRYPRIMIAAPPPTASSCTSSPLSFVSKV